MQFINEIELQTSLASTDLEINGTYRALGMRREVPVGGCIPDLVYVGFKKSPANIPWPRTWSYRHSFVAWLLRKHVRLYPQAIADLTFESLDRSLPVIHDLVTSGAAIELESGQIGLASELASLKADVIAVEAKLKRWRKALEQAINYQRFADLVIVAMDADGFSNAREIEAEFREQGVGLVAVARGSLNWLVMPKKNSYASGPEREYLVRSATAIDRQTLWSWRYDR